MYLILVLDGRQCRIELSLSHFISSFSQVLQRSYRKPDTQSADEVSNHQDDDDDKQQHDTHCQPKQVECYTRHHHSQVPIGAFHWRIEKETMCGINLQVFVCLIRAVLALLHILDAPLGKSLLVTVLQMAIEVTFHNTPRLRVSQECSVA